MTTLSDNLLKKLQHCAHELLLAFGETNNQDFWTAWEKTTDACMILYYQPEPGQSKTLH